MALSNWKEFDEFFGDPWRFHREMVPYWRRYRPWHDDFGFEIFPQEFSRAFRDMDRQAREMERKFHADLATFGKDGFQVSVDVQQFSPEEISVKTSDNSVLVEGKHEERQDENGFVSRQFTRRYTIPPSVDPNTITSELSSDGILTIRAPKPALEHSNEKIIPIQYTGPARLNVKENKAIEK